MILYARCFVLSIFNYKYKWRVHIGFNYEDAISNKETCLINTNLLAILFMTTESNLDIHYSHLAIIKFPRYIGNLNVQRNEKRPGKYIAKIFSTNTALE